MLVLTRKINEVIMVGEVEVTVLGFRGNEVRIGITAPKSVPIHRKEVYDKIEREKEATQGFRDDSGFPTDSEKTNGKNSREK